MVFKSLRDAFRSNKPGMKVSQDYLDWRKMIFSLPFDRDSPPPAPGQVDRVTMDMGMSTQETATPWVMTMNVFAPNITTFYLSSGERVFDVARRQPKAAHAASEIIKMAQELRPRTQLTKNLSLPEPGIVQFLFVTPSGVSAFASSLQEVQQSGHSFQPLLERFAVIRQVAGQILEERAALQAYMNKIQALYVMAFTTEQMDQSPLKSLIDEAVDRLKAKNLAFKQRIEGKPPQAPLEMTSTQLVPAIHTPKNMQTLLSEWLSQQYNVAFEPKEDDSFFFHWMRNPQGRQNIFLFYFDFQ